MANKLGMGTGKADVTLVAAGYRLGQSYIPNDYSEIFRIQFEGLAAAHKAKTEATSKIFKSIEEGVTKIAEAKAKEDDFIEGVRKDADTVGGDPTDDQDFIGPREKGKEKSFDDQLNTITTDYVSEKINNLSSHYENGGDFNPAYGAANQTYLNGLADEYEVLNNKLILNKEERNRKKQIKKQITDFRGQYNQDRGNFLAAGVSWRDGYANKNLSFSGMPGHEASDLQVLFGQIWDPEADFKKEGLKVFWDKGKKYYEYEMGRANIEAKKIAAKNKGEEYVHIPGERKIISEKNLLAQIQPKDIKTEGMANGIDKEVLSQVNSRLANTKTLAVKNFDAIQDKVERDYYDVFIKSKNFQDLATREVLVGNKNMIWKDDLQKDHAIDVAVINQMGIGSDVFTEEELRDGKIDPTELAKHKNAKTAIIEMLTNPKTATQREIAAKEMAKYRTGIIRNTFEEERERIAGDSLNIKTTPATTTTLFGNTVPLPQTAGERLDFAIVQNIAKGKKEVTVKGVKYTYNPKTKAYSYPSIETKTVNGEEVETQVRKQISREDLIGRQSSIYTISNDYFTKNKNKRKKASVTDSNEDPVLRSILEKENRAKKLINLYSKNL